MLENLVTTEAPEPAAEANRLCQACGCELPRHRATYCNRRCYAIGREMLREHRPQQPQAQGPMLLDRLSDRLAKEMAAVREELIDLRTEVERLLHQLLERVDKGVPVQSKLLGKQDAATYLGTSTRRLMFLVHDQQLPFLRLGNRMMFKKTELANYIERNNRTYSHRNHR